MHSCYEERVWGLGTAGQIHKAATWSSTALLGLWQVPPLLPSLILLFAAASAAASATTAPFWLPFWAQVLPATPAHESLLLVSTHLLDVFQCPATRPTSQPAHDPRRPGSIAPTNFSSKHKVKDKIIRNFKIETVEH